MQSNQWLMTGAAFAAWSVLILGAAWWWTTRKLRSAAARLDKVDKARQFAAQQAAQARKQIEGLQQELAALRLAAQGHRPHGAHMAMAPPAPQVPDDWLPRAARGPEPPADGFADTQVLRPYRG
ncbi:hypothetical protein OOZ63_00380 [Paucibacter sp. PLA-PC-4]|uniref:hypothetical protein n=1 Tax=Paucibacter sp. PLA-PC-4 TaxID=2993655 RepID=UPI0022491B10|nr:hypothetical protein [Paucibacter sp. PLA-PC-4]MCX2860293.1 hypothetical protein [Paucibacter sp. PLA-PC-4]